MSPTRRVLLAIGVLVSSMIAGLLLSWHLQVRALGDALVADVTATTARTIERSPRLDSPRHQNGYACLSAVIDATPKDLSPIGGLDSMAFKEILDAGVVSEAWQPKLSALEPWAESARDCGDAAQLEYVPEVAPFAPFSDPKADRAMLVILALTKMTRLQARLLAIEGEWDEVARLCVGTLEVALDLGHLNLIGAMVANNTLRQLMPPCGEAVQHLSTEARPGIVARLSLLPSRLVSNAEVMGLERQAMSLVAFGGQLTDEQRATLPPGAASMAADLGEIPVGRFMLPRLWPRWDRAMRQLVLFAGEPGVRRQNASLGVDAVWTAWWVPNDLNSRPNYEESLARNDEAAVLLKLLIELTTGDAVTPSPTLVRTLEGFEFTDFRGETLRIRKVN